MVSLPLLRCALHIYEESNGTILESSLSCLLFVMYLLFLFVVCYTFVIRFLFDVLCHAWDVGFLKCLLYIDLSKSYELLLMCLLFYVLFDISIYYCFSWTFMMVLVSLSIFHVRYDLGCKFT